MRQLKELPIGEQRIYITKWSNKDRSRQNKPPKTKPTIKEIKW